MLPSGWQVKYSKSHNNRPYYFNSSTGVTQWELPSSESCEDEKSNSTKVHVFHLLVKHSGSRRPSSWREEVITCSESEALQEIRELRSEIYASQFGVFEAFKAKAAERSDCSSAKRGGDLGFFGPGEMQSKEEFLCVLVF
jgi:peptidyl-prolyl cis-trans isomerase NIMA-interacting 1